MSRAATATNGPGPPDSGVLGRPDAPVATPNFPRDQSSDSTPTTESQHSRQPSQTPQTSQASQTTDPSSVTASPQLSRESSPTRTSSKPSTSRASSTKPGTRSRRNSQQETSPPRQFRQNLPQHASSLLSQKTLSAANTPTLLPAASDPGSRAPGPQKSPTEHLRDTPRWPVSPRLRSPPPVLNRPSVAGPRKVEQEPPAISVQRATPSPQPPSSDAPSDSDLDDLHLPPGVRTPARGTSSTSTLETVQEASPLASPGNVLVEPPQTLEEKTPTEAPPRLENADSNTLKPLKSRSAVTGSESGSETGSIKLDRRSGAATAPPSLTARQSSASTKTVGGAKSKAGEGSVQSMTVETETVTSIPQVALAANAGQQGPNASLRKKPSSETIRPKKEKKKTARKTPSVTSGTGEPPSLTQSTTFAPRLGHHHYTRTVSSATDACFSPTKLCGLSTHGGDVTSPRRPNTPSSRSQSLSLHQVSNLLTRHRPASSKADIFEQKVASAVEEADSSDSDETFVYDSNPPDSGDRARRFHSRTPSATSMASQLEKTGMRSIHAVMEGAGPSTVAHKKNMKFVSNALGNGNNGNENSAGDDDGKGTGRSTAAGSARGTARHHHHFGRWGRVNGAGGNGHPPINTDDFFQASIGRTAKQGGSNSRQSSAPPSPSGPNSTGRGFPNGKRSLAPPGYDLDDTTTGADDERTPLIGPGTGRSARSGRNRRPYLTARSLEQQSYGARPSVLNRFATCLVVTVMLLLVVSGAIGFMFATSQPLLDVQLVAMKNVLASEQELMLDLTVKAHNPNIVVVVVDSADIEVFAKSPYAGTDSDWWRKPEGSGTFSARRPQSQEESAVHISEESPLEPPLDPPPVDDTAPNMRLGTIKELYNPLSFEGSFFHEGISSSTGQLRLRRPGNDTEHGSERWERILEDEFDLILMGVLTYSLPLTQHVRSVSITGRTTVKPNSANDPTPNATAVYPTNLRTSRSN